jgi:hypothetical protein
VNVSFFSAPWFASMKPTGGSGAGVTLGHFDEAGASSTTTPWSCCLANESLPVQPGSGWAVPVM